MEKYFWYFNTVFALKNVTIYFPLLAALKDFLFFTVIWHMATLMNAARHLWTRALGFQIGLKRTILLDNFLQKFHGNPFSYLNIYEIYAIFCENFSENKKMLTCTEDFNKKDQNCHQC